MIPVGMGDERNREVNYKGVTYFTAFTDQDDCVLERVKVPSHPGWILWIHKTEPNIIFQTKI
jgi:hypothetical protein